MSKSNFIKSYKLRKKCDKPKRNPKEFAKCRKNLKKSESTALLYRESNSTVDATLLHAAEGKAFPAFTEYLESCLQNAMISEPITISLENGRLTVHQKDHGLYAGFYSDKDGQVIHQFDNMTIPVLAWDLENRGFYKRPLPPTPEEAPTSHKDEVEDVALINEALEEHNEVYHQGQKPYEPINSGGSHVRLKFGDLEIEIKKSIHNFAKSYKSKSDLKKALASWRRNNKYANFKTDEAAAQSLLANWDQHSESFIQTLHAVKNGK